MEIEKVAPELREAMQKLPSTPFGSAVGRAVVQTALALLPTRRTPGVRIESRTTGHTRFRLHLPEQRLSDGALLWIQGGGYLIGRAKQDDALCGSTARKLGIPVLAAEYRLPPTHAFPAPLDDVHTVWSWLVANLTSLGVNPNRLAIGGQSAGGGLAAALIQRAIDENGIKPCAQWLLSPMLDDRTAARREYDAIDHFVWNNEKNRLGWQAYLSAAPGLADSPPYAAAARRKDLSGLPSAWIGIGDIDLFRDEAGTYAKRLAAAGIDVQFQGAWGPPRIRSLGSRMHLVVRLHHGCAGLAR